MADEKMPSWPSWMPLVQQDDYSYEIIDRRTKTDMEVGSILRVNFDSDEVVINCSLLLDQVQSGWFEAFEKQVLRQGSRWFEIPLQTGGKITTHVARFKNRPKVSLPGPFHNTYSFVLEIEKRPTALCPALFDFVSCVGSDVLCRAATALTLPLHSIIPSIKIPGVWCQALREYLNCASSSELCNAAEIVNAAILDTISGLKTPNVWIKEV